MDAEMTSEWMPLEAEDHAAQLAAVFLLAQESGRGSRLLDIGAGTGRVAHPLAQRGHHVVALDNHSGALERLGHAQVTPVFADALDPALDLRALGPFDGALCLGHTFMLFHDVLAALGMLRRVRAALNPGGWFAIDYFAAQVWRDVADGDWQTGLSEDDQWQFIWSGDDNTAVIRHGAEVRPRDWDIGPGDRLLRLWTPGELRLLAAGSGFLPPEQDGTGALLVFRCAEGA